MNALCEFKRAHGDDDVGGDEVQCHRDADGAFEMVMNGDVAAVMALCEDHREFWEDRRTFEELRPTDDYDPATEEREVE